MPIPKNASPGGNSNRGNDSNRGPGGNPPRNNPNRSNNPNIPRRPPAGGNQSPSVPHSPQRGNGNARQNPARSGQNPNQDPRQARRPQQLPQNNPPVRGQGPRQSTAQASHYVDDELGFEENQSNQVPSQEGRRRPPSSHVEQYDYDERSFDNTPNPSPRENYQRPNRSYPQDDQEREVREPFVNEFDEYEDETFSPISIDEQLRIEDEEDNRSSNNSRNRSRRDEEVSYEPSPLDDYEDDEEKEVSVPQKAPKSKPKKVKKNRKDKKGQDVFIDEKKGVVKPFGGRKIKENEFDKRKNIRKNAIVIQWVVISLIVILVGLGVKNAVVPPKTLDEQEVADIAAVTTGVTNYPLEKGKGFATDFMKAYLTINNDEVASKVLGYYYSGSLTVEDDNSNKEATSNYKQTILYGPTVYDSFAFNDYSARYTIGSLVKPGAVEGKASGVDPHWVFFNVNVYYNSAADSFTITDDSPTVVPSAEVGNIADLPERQVLGTGEADQGIGESIKSVVFGFLQGYAESSPADHSSLDQYITDSKDSELIKGLDGEYEFSGEMNDAVQFEAFPVDESESPTEIKALTKVRWANKVKVSDQETRVDYTSTYVMTLQKVGDKYLVSKFQPQYYASEEAEKPVVPDYEEDPATDTSIEEE